MYKKSMSLVGLLSTTAIGIFAYCGSLAITIWAVSDSDPVGGHEFYDFVLTGLVPTVTFDSMLHSNFPYTYTTP